MVVTSKTGGIMAQEIGQQSYHKQFDTRLASILDSKSLSFLDELLKEARKELFESKEKTK